MKTYLVHLSHMDTNCYIASDEETNEAVVIDPGEYTQKLIDKIEKENLTVKYILLTHGHFDHILGVYDLKQQTDAKVLIHKADADCLEDETKSLMSMIEKGLQTPLKADMVFDEGDKITFGNETLEVMHTPGHTKGSVCFVNEKERVIFSGDTMFYQTYGRTDFPGGSVDEMVMSLYRLYSLRGDYSVYPGHGIMTTIERERKTNRYMGKLK